MKHGFSLVELSSLASGRCKTERAVTQGFSLVELSIVLVILGLLTGGILAGQNLIRAAELRSVTTEFAQYQTAAQTFRDKYFAIPGDFRDATKFWGRLSSAAHCVTNSAQGVATPGACDGNGNGIILGAGSGSQAGEMFGFWHHLAHAGLIEGSYTGLSDTGAGAGSRLASNVPRSKISQAGWSILHPGNTQLPSSTLYFEGTYANTFYFGGENLLTVTEAPVLVPEEAWNIDTKADDGVASTGRIVAYEAYVACHDQSSTSTSALAGIADYDLTNTSAACNLLFKNVF